MTERVVADTSVVSRLTKEGPDFDFYTNLVLGLQIAVSFQTRAELLSVGYSPARQTRLNSLIDESITLPHTWQTSLSYARVAQARTELKRAQEVGGDAADGDVWVIAGAVEYFLPLLSHDRQQVALGRAAGLDVWTNLPALRAANPKLR